MSECKHEYLLDVQGGFYYCPNCPDEWTIQDLLRTDIENQARIKALEGVVKEAHQLVDEIYYALVGGNLDNESITRDVVGRNLMSILKKLEEV